MLEVVKPAAQCDDRVLIDRLPAFRDADRQRSLLRAAPECSGEIEVSDVGTHGAKRMDSDRVEPRGEQLEQRAVREILEPLDQSTPNTVALSVRGAQSIAFRVDRIRGEFPLEESHLTIAFAKPRSTTGRAALGVVASNRGRQRRSERRGRAREPTAFDEALGDLKEAPGLASPRPQ